MPLHLVREYEYTEQVKLSVRDHLFITFAKFSEKVTFLTP